MAAAAGRDLRIKYDPGTGAVVIAGATSDNFSITREGINITDKDDLGVQTFIDDAIGTWAASGSVSGNLVDTTLLLLANSETAFTADFEVQVAGLGTYAGSWGITEFSTEGAEGAETMTFSCSLVSSGSLVFTAA